MTIRSLLAFPTTAAAAQRQPDETLCWQYRYTHGLSQQGVWMPFWTPRPLKRTPQDTLNSLWEISKNLNLKLIIEFFHLLIIPMTLFNDLMPYFDEFINVYGWNMSILWSPLKIWTPQNFTTANFRHPVSKSWLRLIHQQRNPARTGSNRPQVVLLLYHIWPCKVHRAWLLCQEDMFWTNTKSLVIVCMPKEVKRISLMIGMENTHT